MSKIKETSTYFENKQKLKAECADIYAMNILAGQWILPICCQLSDGKLRFGELKKRIPNITERMLTLQLRKMESDCLITRKVFAEVPPRVEYELTESGQKLKPILKLLEKWGEEHQKIEL